MNALDLVSSPPIAPETIDKASAILSLNYGVDYTKEKFLTLFTMMEEEGWTEYRFQQTFKWFLKNKPWAAWTIADWFQHGVKVYPPSWAYGKSRSEYDAYEIAEGVNVYKPKDGVTLPFPEAKLYCLGCQMKLPMSTKHSWNFCDDNGVNQ